MRFKVVAAKHDELAAREVNLQLGVWLQPRPFDYVRRPQNGICGVVGETRLASEDRPTLPIAFNRDGHDLKYTRRVVVEDQERDRLLHEIRLDVAVIKTQMDILKDHEARLRGMERFRFAFPGVAVIAVVIAGAGLALNIL